MHSVHGPRASGEGCRRGRTVACVRALGFPVVARTPAGAGCSHASCNPLNTLRLLIEIVLLLRPRRAGPAACNFLTRIDTTIPRQENA